jgi:hypothetical protein
VPERSDSYGAEVWARLEPQLHRPSPFAWLGLGAWLAPSRLAWAGGVAVLVLAAFVAGRFSQRPVPPTAPGQPSEQSKPPVTTVQAQDQPLALPDGAGEEGEEAASPSGTARGQAAHAGRASRQQLRRTVLLVAVGDHLERSQMALVELVNLTDGHQVDIAPEQERARDLVAENRLIRQTAVDTGNPALVSLLDELERVLVEVANSPSEMPKADYDRVRQQIESQGIIFKVRAVSEHVRELETRPAADGRVQG